MQGSLFIDFLQLESLSSARITSYGGRVDNELLYEGGVIASMTFSGTALKGPGTSSSDASFSLNFVPLSFSAWQTPSKLIKITTGKLAVAHLRGRSGLTEHRSVQKKTLHAQRIALTKLTSGIVDRAV